MPEDTQTITPDQTQTTPQATEPVLGAQEGTKPVEGETTPTPDKTISQEDWDTAQTGFAEREKSMRDGHKGTVDKLRGDLAAALQQTEQLESSKFLAKVEEDGGDVEKAKDYIRRLGEVTTKEREQSVRQVEIEEATKYLEAARIAKENSEYGVTTEVLLKAGSPAEMEMIALKAKLSKIETNKVPPQTVDKKSGTASKGVDISSLSNAEKLGMAMDGKI